jgi:hypothetical protein
MRVGIEVPGDLAGWGALRILRGRLEDDGYWTGEYRTARGVMIRLSGARLPDMADPPAWRGQRKG